VTRKAEGGRPGEVNTKQPLTRGDAMVSNNEKVQLGKKKAEKKKQRVGRTENH